MNSGNVSPLLRRVFLFLEDKNWQEADEYCEKVLDLDPENAMAYVGKLMAYRLAKRKIWQIVKSLLITAITIKKRFVLQMMNSRQNLSVM